MKNQKGITLISLVITIVVLIILAGVAVNMTIGENGIFTKAQEAKKAQTIADAKEQIGLEILTAQMKAIERNQELEQTQIEDIISKYGELQADGDTIILKDNGYEVSLLDIYSGTATTTGSYTESQAKIALLESQVATLQQQLEDAENQNNISGTLLYNTVSSSNTISFNCSIGDIIVINMQKNAGTTDSFTASATGCEIVSDIGYSNVWLARTMIVKATDTTITITNNTDFNTYYMALKIN